MNGIELSRRFYQVVVGPALQTRFGAFSEEMSVALLGEGSEVLGYDDRISEDHNFWPRVTVFLSDDRFDELTPDQIEALLADLPAEFEGYRLVTAGLGAALAVQPLPTYFREYLSASAFPLRLRDWLLVETQRLRELTAATIFHDPSGQLASAIQAIRFYPVELMPFLIHRLLARLSEVGGIERSIRRNDPFSAQLYFANYAYHAVQLMHLLHGVYCPYPKWLGRSLRDLAPDGPALWEILAAGFRVQELGDYRRAVLGSYHLLRERIQTAYGLAVDTTVSQQELHLLDLPGLEALLAKLRGEMPDHLRALPAYIQPPAYWGMLFDYGGYEIGFKDLLKASQELASLDGPD